MATVIEQSVPPLCNGDKLSIDEFMRIWEAHPEIKHAELIGGMVFMSSPVSLEHSSPHVDMTWFLTHYTIFTPGTASGVEATTFLRRQVFQPDGHLRILQEFGGGSWIEEGYLHGKPELLVEVARSSKATDLHLKLDLYEEAQIPEYLVILTYEQEIRWHVLKDGKYQLLAPDADGIHRSRVFPGLWLDGKALLTRNMAQVLAVLQQGLAAPEHQAFVADLSRRGPAK